MVETPEKFAIHLPSILLGRSTIIKMLAGDKPGEKFKQKNQSFLNVRQLKNSVACNNPGEITFWTLISPCDMTATPVTRIRFNMLRERSYVTRANTGQIMKDLAKTRSFFVKRNIEKCQIMAPQKTKIRVYPLFYPLDP